MAQVLTLGTSTFTLLTPQTGQQPAVYKKIDASLPVAQFQELRLNVQTSGNRIRVASSLGIPAVAPGAVAASVGTMTVTFQFPADWSATQRAVLTNAAVSLATKVRDTAVALTPNITD